MRTLKLHLDDLQVTSFDTSPAAGARGTVVGHDVEAAPPDSWYDKSCQMWVGTCGTCPSDNIATCFGCETAYDTCGVTCASCAASCAAQETCYDVTCFGYYTCAKTCWNTCGTPEP